MPLTLDAARRARSLLTPHIRSTPVLSLAAGELSDVGCTLKLECLQHTGAFKVRGALVAALKGDRRRALVTASGGNHGLGVAFAAQVLDVPATVVLPESAPESKAEKLRRRGALVVRHGAVWDDAWEHAVLLSQSQSARLIHPFADEDVLLGQATIGLELAEQAPDVDTWVIPIGGGGLIGGVAFALKSLRPDVRIVGVEPTGAPTLYESVRAGKLVTLPIIQTAAGTLAPRRSAEINLRLVSEFVDDIVLVSDEQMFDAARWLWSECAVPAELAAAAATAAIRAGTVGGRSLGAIVCGTGTAGMA
ncbi:MAG: threonine dehydratase [Bradymonadia bacterium]|jgi:threonine dehydratase